jgi:hypothetical protein
MIFFIDVLSLKGWEKSYGGKRKEIRYIRGKEQKHRSKGRRHKRNHSLMNLKRKITLVET